MIKPGDEWVCPVCWRGMTVENAVEGFCVQSRRSPICPLPVDWALLQREEKKPDAV